MWNSLDSGINQIASPILPTAIYVIVAVIVIIENGLIFGFFLPGDLLLIAAGVLAGSYLDIELISIISTAAAASIIGSQIGYLIGNRFGGVLEKNKNTPSIQNAITLSHKRFADSQVVAVFIANFVPGMRIFIPIIAGNHRMNRLYFAISNILGSIAWAGLLTAVGYTFSNITSIRENPLVVLAALFLVASGASMINFFRSL